MKTIARKEREAIESMTHEAMVNELRLSRALLEMFGSSIPRKLLSEMNAAELNQYIDMMMRLIHKHQPRDCVGCVFVLFETNERMNFASTVDASKLPPALRVLADRIELKPTP